MTSQKFNAPAELNETIHNIFATLLQHSDAVLRWKLSLRIVPCLKVSNNEFKTTEIFQHRKPTHL